MQSYTYFAHKPSQVKKHRKKGQQSMLNIMAVVIVVSVIFLYFFYVTQSQKVESSNILSKQHKYRYAEIVLTNMYYIKQYGFQSTISEIIGQSQRFGDESHDYEYMSLNSKIQPKTLVKQYLDNSLSDYNYYFFIEREETRSFEISQPPPEDVNIMTHVINIPLPNSKEVVAAYLYVW